MSCNNNEIISCAELIQTLPAELAERVRSLDVERIWRTDSGENRKSGEAFTFSQVFELACLYRETLSDLNRSLHAQTVTHAQLEKQLQSAVAERSVLKSEKGDLVKKIQDTDSRFQNLRTEHEILEGVYNEVRVAFVDAGRVWKMSRGESYD